LKNPFLGGLDIRQEDSHEEGKGGTACIIPGGRAECPPWLAGC
jgi:hypothetical protein